MVVPGEADERRIALHGALATVEAVAPQLCRVALASATRGVFTVGVYEGRWGSGSSILLTMLFEARFVDEIEAGRVTLTFRRWKRSGAKVGSTHRIFGRARIEIDAVDVVDSEEMSDGDARDAGFADVADLRAYLDSWPGDPAETQLYRIAFRYSGPIDEPTITVDEMPAVLGKLAKMDRLSMHGPWTAATIRLIGERPRTRAGDLADSLGRERLPFKADVRKLKYMGLTRSLEVGYELTEAGERVLALLEQGTT